MCYVTSDALEVFFGRLRTHTPFCQPEKGSSLLGDRLPGFFTAMRGRLEGRVPLKVATESLKILNTGQLQLAMWCESLREPLARIRGSGVFCSPWRVAKLGRDEIRNAAVLAWLLDPHGDHGFGDRFLRALLDEIRRRQPESLPPSPGAWVSVNTESYPENDQANRVDIEIDAAEFYLLVEVKISAKEVERQMERYGGIAEKQAGRRPWAMVFLSPRGGKSTTAGRHEARIVPLSWAALAALFRRTLDRGTWYEAHGDAFSSRLAELYLRHVRDF